LWAKLDRTEAEVSGNVAAQAARFEAEEILAPPAPPTGLAAAPAPRVARVKLEPPRPPSRAPNEPYQPPGGVPDNEGAEGPDTVQGLVGRAFAALAESVFGVGSAETVDSEPVNSVGQTEDAANFAPDDVRDGRLGGADAVDADPMPLQVRTGPSLPEPNGGDVRADEARVAEARAGWPAPWWLGQSLRFLVLAPPENAGCPGADEKGWTGDAMILGEPLAEIAGLDTAPPAAHDTWRCPTVVDMTFRKTDEESR